MELENIWRMKRRRGLGEMANNTVNTISSLLVLIGTVLTNQSNHCN